MSTTPEAYFWGCWNDRIGHYLWRPTPTRYEPIRHAGVLPWHDIDGTLPPKHVTDYLHQVEGEAVLHYLNGWTALAWWDRSVDTRHGSNAALFAYGTFNANEMLAIGREVFPGVMVRMKYEIVVRLVFSSR